MQRFDAFKSTDVTRGMELRDRSFNKWYCMKCVGDRWAVATKYRGTVKVRWVTWVQLRKKFTHCGHTDLSRAKVYQLRRDIVSSVSE